jgi:4-hydroxysphinganine ceramide fatty acyl 2-hydroxylase
MEPRFVTTTDTKGWLLDKFAMGTANYWFAFFADFATAMFFLGWEMGFLGRHFTGTAAAFFSGYLAWTLTEYVFHRWVYHQPNGIFGVGHNIHHAEAQVLIAMPWFMTTLTMFGLWQFFSRYLGIPYFSSVLAGWLVGFVWYSLVHHSHHHWNLRNGWIRRLKAYHRVHHQFPGFNYGVTLRFWDVIFRTSYRKSASDSAGKNDPVVASGGATSKNSATVWADA